MASQIKISQLPEVTTVDNSDIIIVDNGTTTSKATKTNLLKEVNSTLGNKVDKVSGKGLSTNDYTTTEKNKLAGIEVGANKYVLPSDVVKDSSYVHTDNNYTTSEKNKLAGLSNYDDSVLSGRVTTIEGKIPSQASSTNQLADKSFVNSSIATNTANYISNNGQPFTKVSDLPTTGVTNNDYAFVTGTESGNSYYDRYKATVSGSTVTWAREYRLNNSSFTANQWSAINSGATSEKINSIADKVDKETGKGLFSGDYNDLTNKPTIPTVPTNVSAFNNDAGYLTEHQDISGKQDKLTAGTNITIVDNIISSTGGTGDVTKAYVDEKLLLKQDKTDNDLTTTSKTVVGGINELKSDISLLKALGLKVIEGYICQE